MYSEAISRGLKKMGRGAIESVLGWKGYGISPLLRPNADFLNKAPYDAALEATQKQRLRAYIRNFRNIQGWFSPFMVKTTVLIHLCQKSNDIMGNVGEIGVYHGKSFLPLYILCDQPESAVAVDFGLGVVTTNGKPSMYYPFFIENIKKYGGNDLKKLRILREDSRKLSIERVRKELDGGYFRIVSVDGDHSSESTLNDLQLAAGSLAEGGVIMLDDYFNMRWPEVSEGFHAFMRMQKTVLRPFFIGFNKILLAHPGYVLMYQNWIEKHSGEPSRRCSFFGGEVLFYC